MGNRRMVVCPHAVASAVGLAVLQRGGHAVDAAIAVNAALGVVYPHMTGLGGDGLWLIYEASTQQVIGLNGSGRAGRRVSRQVFEQQGLTAIPQRGPQSVLTVPGSVDAWWQAHQRFGRLPWADVLAPAIALAEQGCPAASSVVDWTQRDRDTLRRYSRPPIAVLPHGNPPHLGETLTNPALGAALRQIASGGVEAFYRGDIAQRIVAHLQDMGGWLDLEDFAAHTSTWVEPISTTYRGYRVWQLPPNSSGFTVLQMLNIVESFNLQAIGHGTVDYYHLLVEATKLAFADRDRWLSDPDFVDIPLAELISKAYARRRFARLSMATAQAYQPGAVGGDTTYSAVVDGEGNAVSLLQSIYLDYGSAIIPPDLGFALHNRGAFFALDPDAANVVEPGKRPFHTLMPALVCQPDGRPYLVLGTMGGEGQPQTQLALLTRVLDFGFDPQTAIDLPRWLWGRTWGAATVDLLLEGRIPADIHKGLAARGHPVKPGPNWTDRMGHAHMIRIDPTSGDLVGGSDPRSDGAALGLESTVG